MTPDEADELAFLRGACAGLAAELDRVRSLHAPIQVITGYAHGQAITETVCQCCARSTRGFTAHPTAREPWPCPTWRALAAEEG